MLASLSFCQSFNLDLLKASATLTLAELWLALGSNHAKRALSLLHGAFPMILGQGGLELRARAYIVEVKCYLSDPSFSGTSTIVNHCLLKPDNLAIKRLFECSGLVQIILGLFAFVFSLKTL